MANDAPEPLPKSSQHPGFNHAGGPNEQCDPAEQVQYECMAGHPLALGRLRARQPRERVAHPDALHTCAKCGVFDVLWLARSTLTAAYAPSSSFITRSRDSWAPAAEDVGSVPLTISEDTLLPQGPITGPDEPSWRLRSPVV